MKNNADAYFGGGSGSSSSSSGSNSGSNNGRTYSSGGQRMPTVSKMTLSCGASSDASRKIRGGNMRKTGGVETLILIQSLSPKRAMTIPVRIGRTTGGKQAGAAVKAATTVLVAQPMAAAPTPTMTKTTRTTERIKTVCHFLTPTVRTKTLWTSSRRREARRARFSQRRRG